MGWASAAAAMGSAAISAGGAMGANAASAMASKRNFKHRYQWTVKDMKAAGLNPMLGAMNAQPVPAQPDVQNVGDAAVRGASMGASTVSAAKVARKQQDLLDTQTDATRATANKTYEEGRAQEMNNLILATSREYRAAVDATDEKGAVRGTSAASSARFDATISQIQQAAAASAASARLSSIQSEVAQQELTVAQVKAKYADELQRISVSYNDAMAKAAQAGVPAALAEAKFWESAGAAGKWVQFLKALIK